jgi:hypothetical protein
MPMGEESLKRRAEGQAGFWKRGLVVLVFVGAWMALGWVLKLDVNQYLLLGVPLTALFQVLINRRPIRALWVRDAPSLRVDATWALLTIVIAAYPAYDLVRNYRAGWVVVCWMSCAILGAPAAAYSIQNATRTISRAVWPALIMPVVMSALMALGAIARHGRVHPSGSERRATVRPALLSCLLPA